MSEFVEKLLTESELGDDVRLREFLGELEREATSVRPMPSAALAELMRSPDAHQPVRRPAVRARRAVITGAVVVGLFGLGAGAAAASPEARSVIGAGVATIAHLFEPATAVPPAPTGGTTHAPQSPTLPDSSETTAPTPSDKPSDPSASGRDHASPSASDSSANSAASQHSDGSNPGATNGHVAGNPSGNGNSSGNSNSSGNGNGQGEGGPAPTP